MQYKFDRWMQPPQSTTARLQSFDSASSIGNGQISQRNSTTSFIGCPCRGKATGMDTIFGHYFEVTDDGKISAMTTYDDTLTAFNSMKK